TWISERASAIFAMIGFNGSLGMLANLLAGAPELRVTRIEWDAELRHNLGHCVLFDIVKHEHGTQVGLEAVERLERNFMLLRRHHDLLSRRLFQGKVGRSAARDLALVPHEAAIIAGEMDRECI